MITRCCICKKVRQEDGSWQEQSIEGRRDVSDTYCPPCYEKVMVELRQERINGNHSK